MRKKNLNPIAEIFVWLFAFYCFAGCSKSGSNPKPVDSNPLTIKSLSVNSGFYATNVTIDGTGFSAIGANNSVYFNGIAATVLSSNINELIVAVPLAAGTGVVTVTVGGKTATGPTFTYQPTLVIAPFAGNGKNGSANGIGDAASFSQNTALAADASGNIYVADQGNNLIRKITPSGLVSTFAGSGASGSLDGNGISASFSLPSGIATDASGNVYVADKGNGLIRKITPDGAVTTLTVDGSGRQVAYGNPYYLVLDASGDIYFTDLSGTVIRILSPQGLITNYYTAPVSSNGIYGLAIDNTGNLYTVDEFDNQIDKISTFGASLTVFAGSGYITGGAVDGTGKAASFYQPWGLAIDATGNLFVNDRGNGQIRKITPGAVVSSIGGQYTINYYGPVATCRLAGIVGMTVDASGNIYVADGRTIRKIFIQ